MRALATHVRFAFRTLRRAPGFAAIAILCLGVGIGAITTMVEVVDMLLFRAPLHVRHAGEIVQLRFDFVFPGATGTRQPKNMVSSGVGYADYVELRDSVRTFESVGAYHTSHLSLGRDAAARPVTAAFVSGTFFPLLGVRPLLGHVITDDGVGVASSGPPPAVISYALWQSQFGGEADIIGRTITVGKGTYTVAGVAPRGFSGVELLKPMDVWLPIGAAQQEEFGGNRQAFEQMDGFAQVIGRLAPDASPSLTAAQAASVLQAIYVARYGYRFGNTRTVAVLTPIIPGLHGERTTGVSVALWLTDVAAIVLLIACANVAGLLLVRAADRRREVAIRLALGATRGQLAQLFLIEGLILALAGGALGICLREWGGSIIRIFLLPQLGAPYGVFDARILVISAFVTIATGFVCGLVPAVHTWRRDIAGTVVGAPREGRLRRPHVRAALLVGQVALATALVAGAALFVTSWRNVRDIQLGFTPNRLLVGHIDLSQVGYSATESRAMYERMLERVRTLPGVESASLAWQMPFIDSLSIGMVSIPGVDPAAIRKASRSPIGPGLNVISPSFFTTMGTALRSGRAFTDADGADAEPVAVINEKMANRFWPGGNAIGQCLTIAEMGPRRAPPPCRRIVGIVSNTKTTSIRDEPDLQVYAPLAQRTVEGPTKLIVRAAGDPAALVASVRHAMQSVAAGLPFVDVKPMSDYLEPQLRPWQLGASMFTLFGSVALVLAAIGLYGVFSYAIARRTREMGIRAALGARAGDLLRMVLLDGLRLTTAGVIIGIVLAVWIGRVLAALLVGVSGTSPVLLGTATALVLGVTLIAVVLPARRAARIDPAVALRDE
ncbi:MAG TPA: ABC transporter permease [Gemmatimonadaceae bacterium]